MASNRFTGFALAVAQVDTRTVGVPSVGSTYTITCNSKAFVYTAVSTVAADVASALVSAFNALDNSVWPEHREVTAAISSGAIITFTAVTLGKPFTFTYAAGGTGSPTFAGSTTTANSGPKVWSTVANWSAGTLAAAGEDIYLDGEHEILYDLDRDGDGTFASLTIELKNPGLLGLADVNHDGAPYYEYRQKELKIRATTVTIRSTSNRLRIDASSVQTVVNCYSTGSSEDQIWEALTWKGTHASNVFNAIGGSIGIAVRDGEAATVATLRATGQAQLRCGPSTTLTTVQVTDGSVVIPPCATISQDAGSLTIQGTANVTTLTVNGGTCTPNIQGTIATLVFSGAINLDADTRALTITNATVRRGASFIDHAKRTTLTNAWTRQCGIHEFTFIHGSSGTILSA